MIGYLILGAIGALITAYRVRNRPFDPVLVTPKRKPRFETLIIIDGSNVIYWCKSKGIDPAPLITLCRYLQRGNYHFLVYFDANIKHVLHKSGHLARPNILDLQALLALPSDQIEVVSAGTQADEFILKRADTDNGLVISNDRYRDYSDRYNWIKNPKRVHKGGVSSGVLYIPTLRIKARI